MGLDFHSKIYFGFLDEKIEDCLQEEEFIELKEDGETFITNNKGNKIRVIAIRDELEDVRYPKILGIAIEISDIHNRSDDIWVKNIEKQTSDNDTLLKMHNFEVWCVNLGKRPNLLHALTWSY